MFLNEISILKDNIANRSNICQKSLNFPTHEGTNPKKE